VAILKPPPKQLKNATIQALVEESIRINLDSYSKFIGANHAYVVSEALRLLFRKDADFKHWLNQQANNHNLEKTQRVTPTKTLGQI
jgi:hypothetical protein